jgi:hypothetical protein
VTGPATEEDDTDVGLGPGIGVELELAPTLMAKITAKHEFFTEFCVTDLRYWGLPFSGQSVSDFRGRNAVREVKWETPAKGNRFHCRENNEMK